MTAVQKQSDRESYSQMIPGNYAGNALFMVRPLSHQSTVWPETPPLEQSKWGFRSSGFGNAGEGLKKESDRHGKTHQPQPRKFAVMHLSESTKTAADVLSVGTVLASLAAWLPPLAAAVSIVWGCIRIYETNTVQRMLRRRRQRKCSCKEANQ